MQTVKEAILILSVIWIGLMAVSRIQKIYYEWQNHKTRKIYNDTIRMLSKRIQKMNEKGDKILVYIGDNLPAHTHPEEKEEPLEQQMSNISFRICLWKVMGLPPQDLYAQLAEEGAELTQAALKCIRAQGLSQNPTPLSCEDALQNLREEINDVLIAAYVLNLVDGSCVKDWSKLVRWARRIEEKEKRRIENGRKDL